MDKQYLKGIGKYVLSALLSAVLIAYLLYHLSGGFSPDLSVTPASEVTVQSSATVTVTLLRNENLIYAPIEGNVSYLFNDGAKVALNAPVAEVYPTTAGSADIWQRIMEIDHRLRLLEDSNMSDAIKLTNTVSTDKKIRQYLNSLLDDVADGRVSDAADIAESFLVQLNRRRIITHSVNDYYEQIEALKDERALLQAGLSATQTTVTTDKVGYFYSEIDGYETAITSENISSLSYREYLAMVNGTGNGTPSSESKEGAVNTGTPIGKVVSDYIWYAGCEIKTEELHNYETGRYYNVKFPYNNDVTIRMYLYRILSEVGSESAVLLFRADVLPQDFRYMRNQTVQIELSAFTGYRVPIGAVRIVNGQSGVFVLRGSIVEFRRIRPLFEYDGYLLVADSDATKGEEGSWLKKNESIIVKGKALYDGKIVG